MGKPAVVVVPGSFSRVSVYANFVARLHDDGYDRIEVVPLQSAGKRDPKPAATMEEDAEAIQAAVENVSDEGYDVLLMAHSYGGIPATQSIKGLTKKDRAAQGKPGGIIRVLYTTAIVPALGQDSTSVMGSNMPASIRLYGEYMVHEDPLPLIEDCFNDIPFDEAMVWVKRMPPHSIASFGGKLSYEGYKDVPVSYMFAEIDQCITPEMQQGMIDMIEKESGQKVAVYRYPVAHIPYLSRVESVVDAVNKASEEKN